MRQKGHTHFSELAAVTCSVLIVSYFGNIVFNFSLCIGLEGCTQHEYISRYSNALTLPLGTYHASYLSYKCICKTMLHQFYNMTNES